MIINYNTKTDLLYIRFIKQESTVINKRITDTVVLDIGENDKIIGLEILDASKHIKIDEILPVDYCKIG